MQPSLIPLHSGSCMGISLAFWRRRGQERDADRNNHVVTPPVEFRTNLEITISHPSLQPHRTWLSQSQILHFFVLEAKDAADQLCQPVLQHLRPFTSSLTFSGNLPNQVAFTVSESKDPRRPSQYKELSLKVSGLVD